MNKALSFTTSDDRSCCGAAASTAVEKLLSSAAVLPEGEYLGLQIIARPEEVRDGVAFCSGGANATGEDLAWIFSSCAKGSEDSTEEQEAAPDEAALQASFCGGQKAFLFTGCRVDGETDEAEDESHPRFFEEFLALAKDMEVGIRFLAGPDADTGKAYGMMMISLPEELTLRMQSVLSLAFPYLTFSRVEGIPERPEREQKLSYSLLRACMRDALPPLLYKEAPDMSPREYFTTEDLAYQSGEFTPIEELELSVRTYSCLARAGIRSVETLRMISDEDLIRVRNLSRRGFHEVKTKLAKHSPGEAETANAVAESKDITSSMAALEELVGLEEVKRQVKRILALARMKQAMPEGTQVPIVLNMEFTGNPGTAKTTVARILAGVLYDIGILSSREMIEVGRADLVAGYVGQTAEQVKAIFQKAKGKLLFIDEAYAVADHQNGRFGEEAINTLVLEMENNRENTIVVMAGYPDKMDAFFSTNPGLRSRVPFKISFPDYSADELVQIAQMEARKRGFVISANAEEQVRSCCAAAVGSNNAGNGRFCRNLVESSILNYADRVFGQEETPAKADFALAREDFAVPTVLREEKEKYEERTIGFRRS